jgi:hypothetical protein
MEVKMLDSRRGSEGAFSVKLYEAGKVYDMADMLARHFIANGWATETEKPSSQSFATSGGGAAFVRAE